MAVVSPPHIVGCVADGDHDGLEDGESCNCVHILNIIPLLHNISSCN